MPYTEEFLYKIEETLADYGLKYEWPDVPNGEGYWIGGRKDGGSCTSPTFGAALDFVFDTRAADDLEADAKIKQLESDLAEAQRRAREQAGYARRDRWLKKGGSPAPEHQNASLPGEVVAFLEQLADYAFGLSECHFATNAQAILDKHRENKETAATRYWLSWYEADEDFRPIEVEGAPSWWCTGETCDEPARFTICAVVDAESEHAAKQFIDRYWPGALAAEWRFCELKATDWQPDSGRFPPAKAATTQAPSANDEKTGGEGE